MESKTTARPAVRLVAAGLMVAGWTGSVVFGFPAVADPDPSPAPVPAPSQSPPPAAPAGAPKPIDHDGIFTVGKDIAPGTYSSAGPVGNGTCYWKRTSNPDGAMIDNAISKKAQVVVIEATDKTFKTSGCQPWLLTPDAAPPNAPGGIAGAQLQATLGALNGLLAPNGPPHP